MKKINDGGPAFPMIYQGDTRSDAVGMTLRDYFAAKAMQGIVASAGTAEMRVDEAANFSYLLADAMLAAREQTEE